MIELTDLERSALEWALAIVFGVGVVLILEALVATRRVRQLQAAPRVEPPQGPVEPPPL